MISRFLVELTESLCDCATEQFSLDLQRSGGIFEAQITCKTCGTYLVTPVSKIKAVISVANVKQTKSLTKKINSPKLILIQGGAVEKTPEKEDSSNT